MFDTSSMNKHANFKFSRPSATKFYRTWLKGGSVLECELERPNKAYRSHLIHKLYTQTLKEVDYFQMTEQTSILYWVTLIVYFSAVEDCFECFEAYFFKCEARRHLKTLHCWIWGKMVECTIGVQPELSFFIW